MTHEIYCAQCKARFPNWKNWPLHQKIGAGLVPLAAAGGGLYWGWNPLKQGILYLVNPVKGIYKKFKKNLFTNSYQEVPSNSYQQVPSNFHPLSYLDDELD